jgi:uncharacterized protein
MNIHEKLIYVEYSAKNIAATKHFFEAAFGWKFVDYGPNYAAFSSEGLDGGFFTSETASITQNGAALLVFYSNDLEATPAKIKQASGIIYKDIYSFPGGRRFQFLEPSGNEFAVCSDA